MTLLSIENVYCCCDLDRGQTDLVYVCQEDLITQQSSSHNLTSGICIIYPMVYSSLRPPRELNVLLTGLPPLDKVKIKINKHCDPHSTSALPSLRCKSDI